MAGIRARIEVSSIPIRAPLPDIASHVMQTERRNAKSCLDFRQRQYRCICRSGTVQSHQRAVGSHWIIAPGISATGRTASSIFPLRFGWQQPPVAIIAPVSPIGPERIRNTSVPRHKNHWLPLGTGNRFPASLATLQLEMNAAPIVFSDAAPSSYSRWR